jgi:hypothetical protein
VKIKTLYTYSEQVGRRGKDYETKRNDNHIGKVLKIGVSLLAVITKQSMPLQHSVEGTQA